ncbi:MAG: galactose-1-phosphate uridylyltransferase [Candidatus Thorarchaeota archaeon]|nr:galactose-1-phosphate uridylyltransferase [Candidatus Thorarchaeota archaeon]
MSQIRRNLMLGEWVIVTPKRASRPFQDREQQCPFCPGRPGTEGDWRVLTLENKYPALSPEAGFFPLNEAIVMEAPGYGYCRVIVLSRDHDRQMESMSEDEVACVLDEYLRVFRELDSREGVRYVLQFENRGRSIGVSIDHPHAQVYALPFVPPRIEREMSQSARLWREEEKCLVCELLANELKSRDRVIYENNHFVSLVPFGARLPYEVHIYPREHCSSLADMESTLGDLGMAIRDTVTRFSRVFDENAYTMVFHTRPSGEETPYWHFHVEFYPPWRDRTRLKYLAGVESGAWTYTNDSSPEDKARELREAT